MSDQHIPAAFISYCRDDSEFALRLAQDLRAAGADVWIDQLAIPAGRPWDTAIQDALAAAPIMVVILSPHSAASNNVLNEISFALEQGMTVIPAIYRDCVVPLQIHRANRIDFRADYAHGLAALLASLEVVNPDPAVLHEAAEAEAQRKTAWQAREAEAVRLREIADSRKPAVPPADPIVRPAPRRTGIWIAVCGALAAIAVILVIALLHKPATTPASYGAVSAPISDGPAAAASPVAATPSLTVKTPPPQPVPKTSPPRPSTAVVAVRPAKEPAVQPSHDSAPLPRLQQDCKSGDPASCERLGHAYEVGEGVAVDYAAALGAYTRACAANNAEACGRIGFMYYRANGLPEDFGKARQYFTRACTGNYPHACYGLGKLYDEGSGTPVDYGKAAQFYKKACDGGDGNGCGELGYLYITGLGVPQDWDRAKPLLEKGCRLGSQVGCVQLDNVNRAAASKAQNPPR